MTNKIDTKQSAKTHRRWIATPTLSARNDTLPQKFGMKFAYYELKGEKI